MDKTFAQMEKTQATYQMDPFSVGQSELATITIKQASVMEYDS